METTAFWELLVSERFIWAYSGVILLYFVGWLIAFEVHRRTLARDLKLGVAALKRVAGEGEFSLEFEKVDTSIARIPTLADAWREFKKCLIFPGPDEDVPIRNTRDPEEYFDARSLIDSRIHLRFYGSIPGQLTGLGILGTFLGLSAGVALASSALGDSELAQVQSSLGDLLDGASLAFITSIVGLSTSVAFMLRERGAVGGLHRRLNEWVAGLDRRLSRVTSEQLAQEQLVELRSQSVQLKRFNTDLAISIASALDERIAGSLAPALDRLIQAVEGLRSDERQSSEEVLRRLVSEFRDSLQGAAGAQMEAISGSLGELDDTLKRTMRGLQLHQEDMADSIRAVSTTLQTSVEESSSRMRSNLAEALEQLTAATKESAAAMRSSVDEAGDAARGAAQAAIEELSSSVTQLVGQMTGTMRENASAASEELRSAGRSASLAIEASSGEMADRIGSLNESLRASAELVDGLRVGAESVQGAGVVLSALSDELRESLPELREVGDAFRSAGSDLSQAVRSVRGSTQSILEATERLSDSQAAVSEQWREYTQRFAGTDEQLARVFQQIDEGLDRYTTRIRDFTSEVDQALAEAVGTLTAAVHELHEVAEFFADAVERAGART